MTTIRTESRWVTDAEIAALLRLHPGTIRTWRMLDCREGRGTPDRPGRGGLVWRRFGRAVRYLVTADLLGEVEARDAERR